MYDTKKLATGGGFLLAAWAVVALLILNTGVAVALPLEGAGGFTLSGGEIRATGDSVVYTEFTDSAEQQRVPAAVLELEDSVLFDFQITKALDVSALPGLTGDLRLTIESSASGGADRLTSSGVIIKTDQIRADRATFRGFIADERNIPNSPLQEFRVETGPNSQAGAPVDINRPDEGEPAIILDNPRINTYYLMAERVDITQLQLTVDYEA
jgi:hypothetical protein